MAQKGSCVDVQCVIVHPRTTHLLTSMIWYDIWEVMLTCAQKPTWDSLIYCMEPTTKKRKTEKLMCHAWPPQHLAHTEHPHTCLMALFPGLPGWASTRKVKPIWILLKQKTVSGSGISWAVCKSVPLRQITMPAPHHSVFTGRVPVSTLQIYSLTLISA